MTRSKAYIIIIGLSAVFWALGLCLIEEQAKKLQVVKTVEKAYENCKDPKRVEWPNLTLEEIMPNRIVFTTQNDSAWKFDQLDKTSLLFYKIGVIDPKTGKIKHD